MGVLKICPEMPPLLPGLGFLLLLGESGCGGRGVPGGFCRPEIILKRGNGAGRPQNVTLVVALHPQPVIVLFVIGSVSEIF